MTWSEDAGESIDVDVLAQRILDGPSVEGVTFVGGEPFAQAKALAALGQSVRASGLSVITFTGYTLEHIVHAGRQDWKKLLSVTDLLIDGPYRADLPDTLRPWVGSRNQRFHCLTERYSGLVFSTEFFPNKMEIQLLSDGTVKVNGMARMEEFSTLLREVGILHREEPANDNDDQ